MQEGLAADDAWMMVEDEFLDTARTFTRHLHHAEYHRLKRAAREKNASAAQNIVRPVVSRGKLSVESQMKHEAKARAERQIDALRRIEGGNKGRDELEEEAPWARDPHLGGLMSGSQDSSSQLATLAGIKSKTRAAAGYAGAGSRPSSSRHDVPKPSKGSRSRSSLEGLAKEIRRAEASSDEDDLDAFSSGRKRISKESVRRLSGSSTKAREPSMLPPKRPKQSGHPSLPLTKQTVSSSSPQRQVNTSDRSTSTSEPARNTPNTVTATNTTTSSKSSKRKVLTSRFTFFDTFAGSHDALDTMKDDIPAKSPKKSPEQPARPSARKDKEQKQKRSISADEIPTFLLQ